MSKYLDMEEVRPGLVDTIPLCIAVFPWGVLTGALAVQAGFSPIQAQLMSLLVFAGAAQLSAITMIGTAPLGTIYLSTFVISSRHLLYSAVFRQHILQLPLPWRVGLGFLLTDEMYALSETDTQRRGHFSTSYALASGLTFYVFWNTATAIGIFAGSSFHDLEALGLEFAIVATFIAMTFNSLSRTPVVAAIVVAAGVSLYTRPIFPDAYILLSAIFAMAAAYCLDRRPLDAPSTLNDEGG